MTDIGIIIVDTTNYVLANNALINSVQKMSPAHVLAFTDHPGLWNEYDKQLIPKITCIEDYNDIILRQVVKHLQQDHYLVIQYDGFVVDPARFEPQFLEFDYIGAPWPGVENHSVGNGGFSLRSRRLMQAVADHLDQRQTGEAEDLFICRTLRPTLEKTYKMRFAPVEVAERFSFEAPLKNQQTFGFHGLLNLPIIYQDKLQFLFENLPIEILRDRTNELTYASIFFDELKKMELFQLLNTQTRKAFSENAVGE